MNTTDSVIKTDSKSKEYEEQIKEYEEQIKELIKYLEQKLEQEKEKQKLIYFLIGDMAYKYKKRR